MKEISIAALIAITVLAGCKGRPTNDTAAAINGSNLDPFLTCFYGYMDAAGYTQAVLDYEQGLIKKGLLESISQKGYEAYFKQYVATSANAAERKATEGLQDFFKGFFETGCFTSMSRQEKSSPSPAVTEDHVFLLFMQNGGGFGGQEELIETIIKEGRFNTRERRLLYLVLFLPN